MSSPGFRTFSPPLKRFLVATVINMTGSAALFGFALIYFNEIRGLSLGQAGVAVGAMSFTMVILTPFGGSLSDRFGPRRVLTVGCLLSIAAGIGYAFVTSFPSAVAVSMLLGVSNALWFPSQQALLAVVVTPQERPAVSAFQRAAMNLGAALGGVVGGLLVHSDTLSSYRVLFAVNVVTYVIFLAVLLGMPSGKVVHDTDGGHRPGFRAVLQDRFFLRLLATDTTIALGFGYLFAFMPAYASQLGIDKVTIGILFSFGAVAVVVTQIPTLHWVRGRHRMKALALMNAWFVVAFVVMNTTSYIAVGAAIVAIAVAQVLGGFGESLLGAVRNPLNADLAPPALVGRYFGLSTMVFQACMGFANASGGIVMGWSVSAVWLLPLAVSAVGVAATLRLRRTIPARVAISP